MATRSSRSHRKKRHLGDAREAVDEPEAMLARLVDLLLVSVGRSGQDQGHAVHEKGLQKQISVGTLVSSQE